MITTNKISFSAQERASAQIKERIVSGVYSPGSVLPTERALSEEIGISRPIIRTALAEMAASGWIIREHGHRPRVTERVPAFDAVDSKSDLHIRLDTTGVLKTIAAIMPMEPDYPAAYTIVRGIQRTLQRMESSHRLIVFDTLLGTNGCPADEARSAKEREILETIAREGIAGAIFWQSSGNDNIEALQALSASNIPIVLVDRYLDDVLPCDYVGVENRSGAREAVSHLLELGHTRIAHLTTLGRGNEGAARSVRERYEGYRDALIEDNVTFDPELVIRSSREIIAQIREHAPSPITAVFAVNDASAHAFIDQATAAGLRVPEDVSVVGFDDLDRYARRSPFLTTMHIPFEAIGERAADLLLQRISSVPKNVKFVQHTILSTRLIARASSRPLMKGDEIAFGAETAVNLSA